MSSAQAQTMKQTKKDNMFSGALQIKTATVWIKQLLRTWEQLH